MHRPASWRHRRWHLSGLQQADLIQQHARPLRLVLKLPLAGFELGVLKFVRSAGIEDGAFTQDTVHEPALFQLESFSAKRLGFIFVDGHAEKYKRVVTSLSALLC
jgi:hypothetical protein